ncbi:MAG: molybdopterin molybdotransferase MoeA [Methanolinea sp.]|nr:molybdopterin molybdotransferase MoeA [Methanolinea sp.]
MSLFLRTVPVAEAVRVARGIAVPPPPEEVPLGEALGRVLARDVFPDMDIPAFHRSTVDGYAVLASDTAGAGDAVPSLLALVGTVRMGEEPRIHVREGTCAYVPTGGAIPAGADAVVMVEDCEAIGDQVLVKRPVGRGENIVRRGEDFSRDRPALRAGRRIRPADCGVLAAVGCTSVPVFRVPRVGVISTGNELVDAREIPAPGWVRDSNGPMIAAYLAQAGCAARTYGIVPDERERLRYALDKALGENDAVILSGGSSKDERDHTAALIGEMGEVLVHGIAISPGKPTIIGRCRGKPVVGLPGHPASALVVLDRVARPLLCALAGETARIERTATAVLGEHVPSARGREDYVRVRLEGGRAYPVFGKSGLLNTLAESDGIVRIPAEREGLESGEVVEVILW